MKDHQKHHHNNNSLAALFSHCAHFLSHRFGSRKRGQDGILELIRDHPGITQKELSQSLGIQPASVSELLMKLEHKELILREKDDHDRRSIRVTLSERGTQMLDAPKEKAEDPFQALTGEEQEQLRILLEKLLSDWNRRYPMDRHRHKHYYEQENHHGS